MSRTTQQKPRRLDSLRAALADSKNFDALGYGLYLKGDVSTAVSVVEAAEWYQSCRDAIAQGKVVRGMDEAREGLRAALARISDKGN